MTQHTIGLNHNHEIRPELVGIIYASVPLTLITVLINSTVLSIVQWGVITHSTIITWFALTNGLSLLRLFFYLKFKALDTEQQTSVFWQHFLLFSSITSGFLWGAVAIWLFPSDDIAHQVFPAFVLAGMCAGAVTTLWSLPQFCTHLFIN